MAIAVEFVSLTDTPAVTLTNETFFYSAELTGKSGKIDTAVYVALVNSDVGTAALNAESFTYGDTAADTLLFGNTDRNPEINAQADCTADIVLIDTLPNAVKFSNPQQLRGGYRGK